MPTLPSAIICDIDGTLAHGIGVTRKPYEWDKVGSDTLDQTIATMLEFYRRQGVSTILVSGRDGSCEAATRQWLHIRQISYEALHMRPEGDTRNDAVIKQEIYDNHIKGKYNVLFVLDDRNRVVDMWRANGLKCLQVAPGDF